MSEPDRIAGKLEELRQYLGKRFPGHQVTVTGPDANYRYRLEAAYLQDLSLSRQLLIPAEAVADLDAAEVIAFLERRDLVEPLWDELGVRPLELRYNPLKGLRLPRFTN